MAILDSSKCADISCLSVRALFIYVNCMGERALQGSEIGRSAMEARKVISNSPQPMRAILVKKKVGLPAAATEQGEASRSVATPLRRPLGYTFVPYPAELAEIERRSLLPTTQVRILALRRFANPTTGKFSTTMKEIARLVGADRSTVHRALRVLEKSQYVHIRRIRSRTVHVVVSFGGFVAPEYLKEGDPLLQWDSRNTPLHTVRALCTPQSASVPHTAEVAEIGSGSPNSADHGEADRTVPRIENRDIRNNEYSLSLRTANGGAQLVPVDKFAPESSDEMVVQELAMKLGETYINSFLALRRAYGLHRLERACGIALDKRREPHFPLQNPPGAYVRWLLKNGKC